MKWNSNKTLVVISAALLSLLCAGQAMADGTAANTLISNTANVSFTLNGVSSGPIPSPPAEFRVDEKVDVIVDNTSALATNVVAGSSDQGLDFTVTNNSNTAGGASTWFKLTTAADGTDSFDMSNVEIWLDTDNDGVGDTNLTAAIGAGQTAVYYQLAVDAVADIVIVADTPNTATTRAAGNSANYWLVAEAWNGNTDAAGKLAEDSDGNDAAASEAVFDDGDGPAPSDLLAGDGIHSDVGTYTTTAPVTISKIAGNGTSGYHIPGDRLTYTVTVTNTAATAASAVVISDIIPANTHYAATSLACAVSAGGTAGTAQFSTDSGGTWAATDAAAVLSDTAAVRCNNGTIAASGGTGTMTFDVTID